MKMKIKPIKIGKKFVGDNHPCYIIAEIGSNFDGSFSKAKKMIATIKKQERVSNVFKHRATYEGKMTTI